MLGALAQLSVLLLALITGGFRPTPVTDEVHGLVKRASVEARASLDRLGFPGVLPAHPPLEALRQVVRGTMYAVRLPSDAAETSLCVLLHHSPEDVVDVLRVRACETAEAFVAARAVVRPSVTVGAA